MLKYVDNWGGLPKEKSDSWDNWFDLYVPSCGRAGSVGGEMLRAMSRLIYRFYNDGDTVKEPYCLTTNWLLGADKFLMAVSKEYGVGYKTMDKYLNDEEYEDLLAENTLSIYDFLAENMDMFDRENYYSDFTENCPMVEYNDDEDW